MKITASFCLCFALAVPILCITNSSFSQEPMFTDRSESSGMQGELIFRQLGVSWADYNQDGFMDVFIATYPKNQLFKNNGNHTFTDVAESVGLQDSSMEASTGVWGDYDADGDLDLFVGNLSMVMMANSEMNMAAQNRLFRNDDGMFTNVAHDAGVSGIVEGVTGGTTSASWADYNGDNYIDLLVCNRLFGVFLYKNLGNGAFENASMKSGLNPHHHGMNSPSSFEHAAWSDYDLDGDLDLFLTSGVAMMMSHSSMTEMDDMSGMVQTNQMDQSMMSSNILYQNQGNGTFVDVTEQSGLVYESNMARSHSAVWGDFNNDGYPDLFSGNRGSVTMNTVADSKLYQNNQDGTFTDVTDRVGMSGEYSVFGAAWADVNNDGMLDLYIAVHPDMRDHPDHAIHPTRIPHPLYMASQDGTFHDVNQDILDLPEISGITDLGHQGGAAFADTDNDGDLDLVVVEAMGLGPMRYYENTNAALGANWIQIQLQSSSSNTCAIGSKIIVETENRIQLREVGFSSTGWGSQSPYQQTLGLGTANECSVIVKWQNGLESQYDHVAVNQRYVLDEPVSSVSLWEIF